MIWRAGAWEAARCVCAQVRTPSIIPGWKHDHDHGRSSMTLIPLMTIVRRPCALVEISTQTGIRQESPTTSVISIMIVIITMMSAASIVIIIMMSDVIATDCGPQYVSSHCHNNPVWTCRSTDARPQYCGNHAGNLRWQPSTRQCRRTRLHLLSPSASSLLFS